MNQTEATADLLRQAGSKADLAVMEAEREEGLERMAMSIINAGVPYIESDHLNYPFGILVSSKVMEKIRELLGE